MSNKSINESIREAWQKSLQNGDVIRSIKQKEKAQIDSIVENTRNNVLSHIAESDKGFYRPETSPHHKFRDGEYIRRQRLLEQLGGAAATDDGAETEEERKKREAAEKAAADQAAADTAETDTAATDTSATDTAAAEPSGRDGGVLGGIGAGIRGAVGRARQAAAAEKEKQRQRDAGVPDELVGTPSARGAEGDYVPVKLGDEELTTGEQERRRREIQTIEKDRPGSRFGATSKEGDYDPGDTTPENIDKNLTMGDGKPRINPSTGRPAKPGDRWESDDGSTIFMVNPDGNMTLINKTKQTEIDKGAKELEDRVASGELDPDSDEYRNEKRKAEHAAREAGQEASDAEDDKRYKDRHNLSPDATKDDVRNHKRHRGAQNKVEDIETLIERQKTRLKYAKTSGQKRSIELALVNLNRELKRANADVEKYGSAAAGAGKAAATATATDTATDTAAGGGAGGEDGSAVEVTGGPVSTDTVQHGGVVEPKDEPELTVDDIKDTKIDPETGREIVHAAPTRLGGEGGYDISGALSTEIDLDKFGMPDNPDLQLKGTVQSRIRKDGAGYKEMRVDPTDPSGVEYIRNYQDGRKEIRYKTGKVTTLDAQGNAVQAGEAGAAPELSGLQSRKIDAEIAGNKDLQRMKADMKRSQQIAGQDFSGQSQLRAVELRKSIDKAVEELSTRMGVSADQIRARFEADLGIPAKTEAEKQAAATQAGDDVKPDPVTGANAPTNAPPASVAGQPPASPPPPATAGEEEEEELVGPPQPVTSSYNPINKYGINLFEAKGPLQR
jgi:hypothetical protein